MSRSAETHATEPQTPVYRIVVAGALDPAWAERSAGMTLVVHAPGDDAVTTELTGHLADQAALMGVIDRLYSYGATLLSVEKVPPRCGTPRAPGNAGATGPTSPDDTRKRGRRR